MKRFFRRLVPVVCALLMAVGSLSGCGSKDGKTESAAGKSSGKVVINFAGWGSLSEKQTFTDLIGSFNKKYPDIKVNYEHVPGAKSDYLVKLSSKLAANDMPDVFYIDSTDFYEWVSAGRLQSLDGCLANSTEYKEGNIWNNSINLYRYDTKTDTLGKGSLYGLPKDLGPWAMVYNKTLFKAKGVAYPDQNTPMTWNQFVETAKKLTGGEGTGKTFGSSDYTLASAVWSNGADFLSADCKKVTVDTSAFAEAMQWCADLTLKYKVAPTAIEDSSQGWFQRWCNGKIGMAWMGPWDVGTFDESCDFDWDLMPTPTSPRTGKGVSWCGSAALCLSPSSRNKEQAYKLAEYFCMNEDAQKITYSKGQAVPNIVSMAENDYLKDSSLKPNNKQVFLNIMQDSSKGHFEVGYYTKNDDWYDYFTSEASVVWSGEKTAADFCRGIQSTLQAKLDGTK